MYSLHDVAGFPGFFLRQILVILDKMETVAFCFRAEHDPPIHGKPWPGRSGAGNPPRRVPEFTALDLTSGAVTAQFILRYLRPDRCGRTRVRVLPMQNLPRERRLRGRERMGELFAEGRHAASGTVLVRALPAPEGRGRMAAIAGKKLGGAVERNRMRRRLRAAYRLSRDKLPAGWDFALVARRGLLEATWPKLVQDIENAARKAVATSGRPPSSPRR